MVSTHSVRPSQEAASATLQVEIQPIARPKLVVAPVSAEPTIFPVAITPNIVCVTTAPRFSVMSCDVITNVHLISGCTSKAITFKFAFVFGWWCSVLFYCGEENGFRNV